VCAQAAAAPCTFFLQCAWRLPTTCSTHERCVRNLQGDEHLVNATGSFKMQSGGHGAERNLWAMRRHMRWASGQSSIMLASRIHSNGYDKQHVATPLYLVHVMYRICKLCSIFSWAQACREPCHDHLTTP
jgi:hypothetical protein